MTRRFTGLILGGLLASSLAAPSAAQEKLQLTAAFGHPEVYLWVSTFHDVFIPTLAEELAKTGEIQIDWTEAYGGTLVKLGSEAEGFQQGILDAGFVNAIFNPATLGVMNLTYAMPFGPSDPKQVTTAAEKALTDTPGVLDGLADAQGVVYIGGGIAIDDYNIAANKPLPKLADFQGIKIGGGGPNLPWLAPTGAVGVQGSYVTFYNDISTGVYDGNIGWMTANVPGKIYEVAPYWNQWHFGAMYIGGLGVSKMRWDTFSDDTKDAFRTAAAAYSEAYFTEQAARYDTARDTLLANGGEIVEGDAGDRETWIADLPNPTTAWRAASEARGEPALDVLTAYRDALAADGFTFGRDYLSE